MRLCSMVLFQGLRTLAQLVVALTGYLCGRIIEETQGDGMPGAIPLKWPRPQ